MRRGGRRHGWGNTGAVIAEPPAPTPFVYESDTIILLADLDIGDETRVWQGAAGGTMFDNSGGYRLWSSTGNGVIDGGGLARAFSTDADTTGAEFIGLTILNCQKTINGHPVAATLLGGDIPAQTGGGNTVYQCTFRLGGKLEYGGYAHSITYCTFDQSLLTAVHEGVEPLDLSKWSENGASGCILDHLTFTTCNTQSAANSDTNVFYCPKRFGSKNTYSYFSFSDCNGVCFYLDDMASNKTASHFTFTNNPGQAFLIGGGQNITLTDFVDTNSGVASTWDDRGSAQNGTGGTHSTAFANGKWHAAFHNGAWTHGAISGAANASMYNAIHGENLAIKAGGAEPWLATVNPQYDLYFTNETTWGTSGSIEYTYSGTTPAPKNGYASTTLAAGCHAGLTGTINGLALAPPPEQ